uniref:NEDD4 binding protein 3 n=1 Tax=Haplochromis burtoni TaxID=8153 RepID=A0A3Q2VLB0_HAPBU
MATSVQTLPLTRGPSKNFRDPCPAPPLSPRCGMGSVGSLVERPDVSPTKGNRAVPQVRPKHSNGLLKKGFTQRELLNYLNINRWVLMRKKFPRRNSKHQVFEGEKVCKVASMGHINTIGSLDRTSLGMKAVGSGGVPIGEMACRSMATLSRIAPYSAEAPPPYEWTLSLSVEEVVRDLEERLVEKEHELKQMKRNLDESEGAIAQVFEGKQRLWEKEVEELKRLYAVKLRQVSQHAQRSQRSLQLQLFKVQQEKNRLQEELDGMRKEMCREAGAVPRQTSPTLEETQWEVCQKSGEISLLKQQLRDSQAEVTQKLSEIFQVKTELRETRTELRNRERQIDALKLVLQGTQRHRRPSQASSQTDDWLIFSSDISMWCGGPTEERLRAELLLERRQSEAQAMAFEEERHTWQMEKDKVIRYQKELQASYLDMYHRNEALERELRKERGGDKQEDTPSPGLPWIERIESSEI